MTALGTRCFRFTIFGRDFVVGAVSCRDVYTFQMTGALSAIEIDASLAAIGENTQQVLLKFYIAYFVFAGIVV